MKNHAFKTGDRVRIIRPTLAQYGRPLVGRTGTVDRVDSEDTAVMPYRVRVDGVFTESEEGWYPVWYPSSSLEPA